MIKEPKFPDIEYHTEGGLNNGWVTTLIGIGIFVVGLVVGYAYAL